MRRLVRSSLGFSLVDLMITVAVGATVLGVAVPMAARAVDSMRLSTATRDVERELQVARLKAVSANRMMMVRFNCPAARQFRMLEITGVNGTDNAGNRCSESKYPYPSVKDTDNKTPENDGPVRNLSSLITVTGNDIVFTPKGTAMEMVGGVRQPIAPSVTVTVAKGSNTSQVTINGLGKIAIY